MRPGRLAGIRIRIVVHDDGDTVGVAHLADEADHAGDELDLVDAGVGEVHAQQPG